ncbi:hypothetical protein K432DRAFT_401731 [Lepidopterella palustris CBS 459.81]|uniref:Uncharacterized protein n=1 Tax=Lepidopterella palustris CBS 459.81 TaxID=1314670 RepID=A0A8E2EGX7_9PEZI|nr:hypothetical protein K432DRAFT_401731 [Lepidopterella palustris CBS 459.81]
MSLNYSIYGIPVYWLLSLIPHSYGLSIIKNANNGYWENRNPRGLDTAAMYKKSVPAEIFGRFERAEGAHKNGMENMPLFIGAVILGNMANLDSSTLNTVVGSYLVLRVVYTALYIYVTKIKYSYARTGTWFASTSLLLYLIIKAGNKLAYQTGSS